MPTLLTDDPNALRLLMTEDIYKLKESEIPVSPIVQVPAEEIKPAPKPLSQSPDFSYQGENNRYFLILFENNSRKELSNEHKEMLLKIMSAKKLELRDLAIVNLALYPDASFSQLKDFFSCSRVTLFGINPARIGLPSIPANMPEKHMDVKILPTFSLDEMSNSTDKKREFWNVMKTF